MHWSQYYSVKYYIVPFPSGRLLSTEFFFVLSFPQLCGVLCLASRRWAGSQICPVSKVPWQNPSGASWVKGAYPGISISPRKLSIQLWLVGVVCCGEERRLQGAGRSPPLHSLAATVLCTGPIQHHSLDKWHLNDNMLFSIGRSSDFLLCLKGGENESIFTTSHSALHGDC